MPNIFDKRVLIGAVRNLESPTTFIKDVFFPKGETFPTETVEVDFVKGNRRLAPFVHPVKGGKVMEHQGYETQSYKPPLVAPDKVTKAGDLLKRLPGENPYESRSPEERAAERLASDIQELDETITRREEWMCCNAIFEGKIPVIGEGVNEVIDFKFENKITLSGTQLWTLDTADPIEDIRNAYSLVQKKGLINPDVVLMSPDLTTLFIRHPKVKDLLDIKNSDYAVIQPKKLPNGATYIGTIKELALDIYTYNGWYLDDWTDPEAPTTKPLVPEGTIALLPLGEYSMYYGGVETVDEDSNSISIVEGKRVPDTWVTRRPARRFINISSRPIPVPHNVDSWAVVKVK